MTHNFSKKFCKACHNVVFILCALILTLASQQSLAQLASAQRSLAKQPTIVEERAAALVQTVRLDRLTFGPDDNFQPAPFSDGRSLLFTRKAHMNPALEILDIKKRELTPWRSNLRDVDSASVHTSTNQVVFRSFERSPDGEICTTTAMSESITCLELLNGEKSAPFWIDASTIGYIRKDRRTSQTTLESFDLRGKVHKTLVTARLFHPSASADGKRLAWVENLSRQSSKQNINYAILSAGQLGEICTVSTAWPGISAYPRFSADGQHLVFSHYLSDTNQDGRIDGDDHSILARIPLPDSGCLAQNVYPEPLTSLAENCSQPGLSGHQMILACAFEGSLDLYSLPETGVIPTDWDQTKLIQAQNSARTPEDRLLFLLTLASRHKTASASAIIAAGPNVAATPTMADLLRGIFSQALLLDDEAGALGWLAELKVKDTSLSRQEIAAFEKLLQNSILRRSEPGGEPSITLRQNLEAALKDLKPTGLLQRVGRAQLYRLIGNPGWENQAKSELMKALQMHATSELSFLLLSHEWSKLSSLTALDEKPYQDRLIKTKLSDASQLIYWAKSLERMELAKNRQAQLQAWLKTPAQKQNPLPASVQKLIELELLAIEVQKGSPQAYLNYDKVLTPEQKNALLVRLASYRAIRLWTQSDRLKEVQYITTNLFKFIPASTLESTYAKDYFIATSFERGYENIRLNQPMTALGHFYGALVQTDKLEAHWGYLTQMMAAGRENLIDKNIDELKKRNFISETENLVRLYAELAKRQGQLPKDSEGWLEKVKKAEPRPDAFATFLRGSVRLQRVLEMPKLSSDQRKAELETARIELILALDGARNNERLKIQVLTNLGILGSTAKLWGPTQKWWQERLELPFEDPEYRALAIYFRAQALVGLQDFQQASDILEGLRLSRDSWLQAPVLHLRIQSAAFSNRHERVIELSNIQKNLFQDLNDLKRGLLTGRSFIALNRGAEACQVLSQVDRGVAQLKPSPQHAEPSGKDPRRLLVIVAGYLARCDQTSPDSLARLERLQNLLELPLEERKSLAFHETTFLEHRLKTQIRLWLQSGDLTADSLGRYLKDLDQHRTEAGQFVNLGQFEALYALGALSLTSKTKPTSEQWTEIKTRMDSFLNSSRKSLITSDLLVSQRLKLDALRLRMDGVKAQDLARRLKDSDDYKMLAARNHFLAQQVDQALEWLQIEN